MLLKQSGWNWNVFHYLWQIKEFMKTLSALLTITRKCMWSNAYYGSAEVLYLCMLSSSYGGIQRLEWYGIRQGKKTLACSISCRITEVFYPRSITSREEHLHNTALYRGTMWRYSSLILSRRDSMCCHTGCVHLALSRGMTPKRIFAIMEGKSCNVFYFYKQNIRTLVKSGV